MMLINKLKKKKVQEDNTDVKMEYIKDFYTDTYILVDMAYRTKAPLSMIVKQKEMIKRNMREMGLKDYFYMKHVAIEKLAIARQTIEKNKEEAYVYETMIKLYDEIEEDKKFEEDVKNGNLVGYTL